MPEFRKATKEDVDLILTQRRLMFEDMGTPERNQGLEESYRTWLEREIALGQYVGFFATLANGLVIAGAGLIFYDWSPSTTGQTKRGYLLNVYTDPEHRGMGLAKQLVQIAIDFCLEKGVEIVTLHASQKGQPIYQSIGFEDVPREMMWRKK